jgi:hypothetical protein
MDLLSKDGQGYTFAETLLTHSEDIESAQLLQAADSG